MLICTNTVLLMAIDACFQNVWAGFADLGNNPVVFSVVLGTLTVYILLILWATRKDRKDRIKVRNNIYHLSQFGRTQNSRNVITREKQ